MIQETMTGLKEDIRDMIEVSEGDVRVLDEGRLQDDGIVRLIRTAVFSPDGAVREAAGWLIRRAGAARATLPGAPC